MVKRLTLVHLLLGAGLVGLVFIWYTSRPEPPQLAPPVAPSERAEIEALRRALPGLEQEVASLELELDELFRSGRAAQAEREAVARILGAPTRGGASKPVALSAEGGRTTFHRDGISAELLRLRENYNALRTRKSQAREALRAASEETAEYQRELEQEAAEGIDRLQQTLAEARSTTADRRQQRRIADVENRLQASVGLRLLKQVVEDGEVRVTFEVRNQNPRGVTAVVSIGVHLCNFKIGQSGQRAAPTGRQVLGREEVVVGPRETLVVEGSYPPPPGMESQGFKICSADARVVIAHALEAD